MAAYTRGELQNLMYVAESVYGTTPATALTWGGTLVACKPKFSPNKSFYPGPASRSFDFANKGAISAGASVKWYSRAVSGAYDWRNLAAVYGYGSNSGTTEHLGSFSMQVAQKISSAYYYNIYNGCKIDEMTIKSNGVGLPLEFDAEIVSQYITPSTAKTITGLQSVTVGADASEITSAVLTYSGNCQINIAAGGLANFNPKTWIFTVKNNLSPEEGNKVGADANAYSLAAGTALNEGEREIIFSFTNNCGSETYTNAKLANSAITALTIPVGANTVTLSNGELYADDYPERLQEKGFEESTKIRFKTMTIA